MGIVTTVVIVAVLIGEQTFPFILAAILLVGWARYSLQQHSPRQLAAGFGLATVYSSGLLGSVVI